MDSIGHWELCSRSLACRDNLDKGLQVYVKDQTKYRVYKFNDIEILDNLKSINYDNEFEPLRKCNYIYILYKNNAVYIGQALCRGYNTGCERLAEHLKDNLAGKWNRALVFTGEDNWDESVINALESDLIVVYKKASFNVLNAKDEKVRINAFRYEHILENIHEFICENVPSLYVGDAYFGDNKLMNFLNYKREMQSIQDEMVESINEVKNDVVAQLDAKYAEELKVFREMQLFDETRRNVGRGALVMNGRLLNINGLIDEIITPRKIALQMINEIPDELYNSSTSILNIGSKDGIFLICLIEKFMSGRGKDGKELPIVKEIPNLDERIDHLLREQLYGLATSSMAYSETVCNILNTVDEIKINTGNNLSPLRVNRVVPNIEVLDTGYIKSRSVEDINKEMKKLFKIKGGADLKFDIVIGNPPYQETTGGGASGKGGRSIYDSFIEVAMSLSDNVCMITKDNWLQSMTLKPIRDKMLERGIARIISYPVLGEIFKDVKVGATIFTLIPKKEAGTEVKTHFTLIKGGEIVEDYIKNLRGMRFVPTNKLEVGIVDKVMSLGDFESFSKSVCSAYPFGVSKDGKVMNRGSGSMTSKPDGEFILPVLYKDRTKFYYRYTKRSYIKRREELIDKYKVYCTLVVHKNKQVLCNVNVLEPDKICGGTFTVLYSSDDRKEAINGCKYCRTKFLRVLVYMLTDTYNAISPDRFSLVPNQDFSENSDIDWSVSLAEIDKQLYKKYSLNDEEINYIENLIKEYTDN